MPHKEANMIRVTVWNEYWHEKNNEDVAKIYPEGIHKAIAEFLGKEEDIEVRTATLDDPECGLTEEVLWNTDVLIWWGHCCHPMVPDEVAERVQNEVLKGMGMIFLHSAHHSKPFKRLMGTTCNLGWRESGDLERIWKINAGHPITQGIDHFFELEHEETYAEPFGIPEPDEVLFMGWFSGGELFRAGCTFHRENGRIFYFQPGHETFPTFYNENVQTVIKNAVRWAAPSFRSNILTCPFVEKANKE